jgi:Protein of unknown function (DUF3309)
MRSDSAARVFSNNHVDVIRSERDYVMFETILIILLILMLLGAIPRWPHSRNWGYYPSGGLGLVLLIVVILLLRGALRLP